MQLMLAFNATSPDYANKMCLFVCKNCLGPGWWQKKAPW